MRDRAEAPLAAFRVEGQALLVEGQALLESLDGTRGRLPFDDLLDHRAELVLELFRALCRRSFGVDVDHRFVRVGQDLRPAALVEDLDPVEQVDPAVTQLLRHHPHDDALHRPWAGELPVEERRRRQLRDELRQWTPNGSEELEQVAQAGDRVVRGQKLRKDVAAADGAGEDDPVLRSRLRQVRERRRRAHDLEAAAVEQLVDLTRDGDRERELATLAVRADQPQEQEQRLLHRNLAAALVDEVEALRSPVENDAEVRSDGRHELLDLPDGLAQQCGSRIAAVRREPVCGHRFDAERPEHLRQHVRRRREAVIDHDPEATRPDGVAIEALEQVLRVGLARPRRVRDASDVAEPHAAELAAREVLLDLLLQRRRELDPGLLEETDLHDLRIKLTRPDMEAGVVPLGLQQMARDCRRKHAQVGDLEPGRREARDHRPLDHATRGRRLAARDDARVALQRRAERGRDAYRDLWSQVDVDEAGDAVATEEARRGARLPDQALVDLRPGLDLLVRVDPDARHDHALGADRHLVADRDALVDAHVGADVARAAEDRAFDQRTAPDVRRRVEYGARRAGALAQRDGVGQHRVGAN